MDEQTDKKIQTLSRWLYESQYLVVFTGAGISTESGIPDFRGPDGVWTRRDKGLPPKSSTVPWHAIEPNSGHYAIVALQNIGKLRFLISQNVDNLHLKSGIHPHLLAELHGNMTKLRCKRCEKTYDKNSGVTQCGCGGSMKSSVVDFGQSLPQMDLDLSFEHSSRCDLFMVVGSSLVVTPAAEMPKEALMAGAKLVILNQGETPFDAHANLRFYENIGEILPKTIKRLKRLMGLYE